MSFFLVFLAIVLIGATALIGTDLGAGMLRRKRARTPLERDGFKDGFDEPVASLPPVLLPEDAKPADVDQVRFALGLRGYRMDQVDQVLDDLRDQLAARNAEIESLREQLRDSAAPLAAGEQPAAQLAPAEQLPPGEQLAPAERAAAEDRT
ncbi:UNVERIFIED_ORG: DivIVA domain-containing protein [Arthrobacter globiformis]|nr:DivIVA domain-containing protein [Arthrobacter globiformis]